MWFRNIWNGVTEVILILIQIYRYEIWFSLVYQLPELIFEKGDSTTNIPVFRI